VYLTSAVGIGASALLQCRQPHLSSIVTLLNAGTAVTTKDFWGAVSKPYASLAFEHGIQESRRLT
jgi:hypothetical protein